MTLPGAHKEQPEGGEDGRELTGVRPPRRSGSPQKRKGYLEEVKREPFTDPKQDRPTKTGMIHAMGPRWWFPKSCGKHKNDRKISCFWT